MKELYLVTSDERLYQKLRLLLRESHRVTRVSRPPEEGLCIIDLDDYEGNTGRAITVSRGGACDISLPFSHRELKDRLAREDEKKRLVLFSEERKCTLGDEEISLTDVEYRLLRMLVNAEGYVSREALRLGVWNMSTDGGVVNVYIHYLRAKLEQAGEKVILSSRKEGYMINPKYR